MDSLNFEMLRKPWPELASLGGFAERYVYTDPASTLIKLRVFCEHLVVLIYRINNLPKPYSNAGLFDLLTFDRFEETVPEGVITKIHLIRKKGNQAAHTEHPANSETALHCLREAWNLGRWCFASLGNGSLENQLFQEPIEELSENKISQASNPKSKELLAAQEIQYNELLQQIETLQAQVRFTGKTDAELQNLKVIEKEIATTLSFDESNSQKWLIDQHQSGYYASFSTFTKANVAIIVEKLRAYIRNPAQSQISAWQKSITLLQHVVQDLIFKNPTIAKTCSVILEYTIPLESRRIDAVLLLNGVVLVVEFKGRTDPVQTDVDQASAYARDLRAYHKECSRVLVKCALCLEKKADTSIYQRQGCVDIINQSNFYAYCQNLLNNDKSPVRIERFLEAECYRPLPSLIKAARELFTSGNIKRIHRAAIATEPTLSTCSEIVYKSAKLKRHSLILICGVPGAGKTLVGLQLAHANYLDNLANITPNSNKQGPAVFLSGNGPLVEVLQYELRSAGGDGKAFVRGVHDYVKTFTKQNNLNIPHHVLIYDEAQRAFDAAQVGIKHRNIPLNLQGLSEPELFVQFAERVPTWSVIVGLVGTGQEIHIGEEAGIGQWKNAIAKAQKTDKWDIYIPNNQTVESHFTGLKNLHKIDSLELATTIRFHLATQLCDFVEHLLDGDSETAKSISETLIVNGFNLMMTHQLDKAKLYLTNRYKDNPNAKFGIVASAKDRDLKKHGIPKGFRSPGEVSPGQYGQWYSASLGSPGSCTNLDTVITEFGAQGLELDSCLLAWGTDFIRERKEWTNRYASGYADSSRVHDPRALRKNAYRVLLTRGSGCANLKMINKRILC